jgi:hypothetical protein
MSPICLGIAMLAQVFVANPLFNRFLWTLRVALEFAPPLVIPAADVRVNLKCSSNNRI